ncbi:MAG TPA: hypothetical protein VIK91_17930 [Nannocystis sp.]
MQDARPVGSHGGPISQLGLRRRPPSRGAALGLLTALLGGCPDPEGKFNEFVEHTKDDRDFQVPDLPPPPDLGPELPDISGTFLVAVSTNILADLPMQFIATNTMTTDPDGKVTLDASLQPLALDPGKVTTPRTPIGDPLPYTGLPIVDGKFEIDAGTIMLPGMANPITGGDIVATLLMKGTIIDADFYCGEIQGTVSAPIEADLTGSTFAAVRLADPSMLPTDVTINCSKATVTDG